MVLNDCNPGKVSLVEHMGLQGVVPGTAGTHWVWAVQDDEGQPTNWGDVDPPLLYGPEGWCEADAPKKRCAFMACCPADATGTAAS